MQKELRTKALTDFLSLSAGELIGKVAGFFAFTYLARTLTPETYGGVELAFGLLTVFTLIVEFGFGPVGSRCISQSIEKAKSISGQILGARMLLALICMPLMSAIGFLLDISRDVELLIVFMSMSLVFSACNQKWVLQGLEKMVLVSVAQAVRMMLFSVGVVYLVRAESDLVRIGYIEILVCAALATYYLVLQKRYLGVVVLSLSFAKLRSIFAQGNFLGGSAIVWSVTQTIPPITLAILSEAREVAWFGAAYRISNALISFSMLYHFSMFPLVVKRLQISKLVYLNFSKPSVRVTAWGSLFLAYSVTLLSKPLCMLVFGSVYIAAASTLSILIWTVPVAVIFGHAKWVLVAGKQQRKLFQANLAGCVTCVILSFLLIPYFEAAGGAVALLSYFIVTGLVAQYFAAVHVVSIPLYSTILPLSVSGLLVVISHQIPEITLGWFVALASVFVVIGLVLDRRLGADIPDLIKIKSFRHEG